MFNRFEVGCRQKLQPVRGKRLELTAIAGAVGSYAVFDGLAGYPRLAQAVEELGAGAVQTAQSRADAMTYDESMQCVFDGIDRLIATTTDHKGSAPPANHAS